MASPVIAFVTFAVLDMSADAGSFMNIEVKPKFEECPKMDHHVDRCREALLSTPELTHVTLDLDSDDQRRPYELCMLTKLDLTAREAMVWCEHKGSLMCLENAEGPVVALREKPSKVSLDHPPHASPLTDHRNVHLGKYSGEDDEMPSGEHDEAPSDEDIMAAEYRNSHDKYRKTIYDRGSKNTNSFNQVNFMGPPSDYYYPRRENGLGNETPTVNPQPGSQTTSLGPGHSL
ncbi:uncharacterized protein LOC125947134 isoform X3 [Dermacentor silvarum]|uniref:uncharacterized protein LOC125947134 isoform X3 n=1 Tax=Dermacentor silvarum TaxID=543639 RepID=UPI002101B2A6|nr:uncharacterized protein LOC125947134 isoform X3 [Dermacentor silvarum]